MKPENIGLLLSIWFTLMTSCGPEQRSMNELEKKHNAGLVVYTYNEEPFEGFAVINEKGTLKAKYTIVEGMLDGPSDFYYFTSRRPCLL